MPTIKQTAIAGTALLFALGLCGQARATDPTTPPTATVPYNQKDNRQEKIQQAYEEALAKDKNIKKADDGAALWRNFLNVWPGHKQAKRKLAYWKSLAGKILHNGKWLTNAEIRQQETDKTEEAKKREREKIEEEKAREQKTIETWGSMDITVSLKRSRELIAGEDCTGIGCPKECEGSASFSVQVPADSLKNGDFKTELSKDWDRGQSRPFTYSAHDQELSYSSTMGEGRVCNRLTARSNKSSRTAAFIKNGSYKMNIYIGARYRTGSFVSAKDRKLQLANDVRLIDIKGGKKLTLVITLDIGTGLYDTSKQYFDLTEEERKNLIEAVRQENRVDL